MSDFVSFNRIKRDRGYEDNYPAPAELEECLIRVDCIKSVMPSKYPVEWSKRGPAFGSPLTWAPTKFQDCLEVVYDDGTQSFGRDSSSKSIQVQGSIAEFLRAISKAAGRADVASASSQ